MKKKYSVLVVDDAFFIRNLIKRAIGNKPSSDYPYEFEIAGEGLNGEEGLLLYKALKPDIVTVDVNMGSLGGVAFIKKLRAIDKDAQVIVISSSLDNNLTAEITKLGCYFIKKPFQEAYLWTKLDTIAEYLMTKPKKAPQAKKSEPVKQVTSNKSENKVKEADNVKPNVQVSKPKVEDKPNQPKKVETAPIKEAKVESTKEVKTEPKKEVKVEQPKNKPQQQKENKNKGNNQQNKSQNNQKKNQPNKNKNKNNNHKKHLLDDDSSLVGEVPQELLNSYKKQNKQANNQPKKDNNSNKQKPNHQNSKPKVQEVKKPVDDFVVDEGLSIASMRKKINQNASKTEVNKPNKEVIKPTPKPTPINVVEVVEEIVVPTKKPIIKEENKAIKDNIKVEVEEVLEIPVNKTPVIEIPTNTYSPKEDNELIIEEEVLDIVNEESLNIVEEEILDIVDDEVLDIVDEQDLNIIEEETLDIVEEDTLDIIDEVLDIVEEDNSLIIEDELITIEDELIIEDTPSDKDDELIILEDNSLDIIEDESLNIIDEETLDIVEDDTLDIIDEDVLDIIDEDNSLIIDEEETLDIVDEEEIIIEDEVEDRYVPSDFEEDEDSYIPLDFEKDEEYPNTTSNELEEDMMLIENIKYEGHYEDEDLEIHEEDSDDGELNIVSNINDNEIEQQKELSIEDHLLADVTYNIDELVTDIVEEEPSSNDMQISILSEIEKDLKVNLAPTNEVKESPSIEELLEIEDDEVPYDSSNDDDFDDFDDFKDIEFSIDTGSDVMETPSQTQNVYNQADNAPKTELNQYDNNYNTVNNEIRHNSGGSKIAPPKDARLKEIYSAKMEKDYNIVFDEGKVEEPTEPVKKDGLFSKLFKKKK